MSQELLNKAVAGSLKAKVPSFRVGDTVTVRQRIIEGEKERVQLFRGTVIGRRGAGVAQCFTVRRIVSNEGVERTFLLHSPRLVDVEVVRSGRTRRAKLYYLRDRVGKATRLRETAQEGHKAGAAEEADLETEAPAKAAQPGQE